MASRGYFNDMGHLIKYGFDYFLSATPSCYSLGFKCAHKLSAIIYFTKHSVPFRTTFNKIAQVLNNPQCITQWLNFGHSILDSQNK